MRTTIDISEPLLRKAKSKAALEGKKLKDIVNEALSEMLDSKDRANEATPRLPPKAHFKEVGQFRVPILASPHAGSKHVSPADLKQLELNEDARKYGKRK